MIRKRVLEIIALQGAFREIKENLKEIAALEKLLKTFCVFMSGGHSTNLITNRKLSARLHKHAVSSSFL